MLVFGCCWLGSGIRLPLEDQLGKDIRTDGIDVVPLPQFRYGFGITSSIGGKKRLPNPSTKKSNKLLMIGRQPAPANNRNNTSHDDAGTTIVTIATFRRVTMAVP